MVRVSHVLETFVNMTHSITTQHVINSYVLYMSDYKRSSHPHRQTTHYLHKLSGKMDDDSDVEAHLTREYDPVEVETSIALVSID